MASPPLVLAFSNPCTWCKPETWSPPTSSFFFQHFPSHSTLQSALASLSCSGNLLFASGLPCSSDSKESVWHRRPSFNSWSERSLEKGMTIHSVFLLGNPMTEEADRAIVHWESKESDSTVTNAHLFACGSLHKLSLGYKQAPVHLSGASSCQLLLTLQVSVEITHFLWVVFVPLLRASKLPMTPYFNGLFLDSSPLDLGSVKTVSASHTVASSAE